MCYRLLAAFAAISTSAFATSLSSGIERSNMDPAVRAQDDLYLAVNGAWLQRTEIPADKSNYGSFTALDDLSRDRQLALIKELLSTPQPAGSEGAKVVAFYKSFMDQERIERLGVSPLNGGFASISDVKTAEDLVRQFAQFSRQGLRTPFVFSVEVDSKQSDRYLAILYQDGTTLPDRDYYLGKEERYDSARKALKLYIKTMFMLAGATEEAAQADAETVLRLETAIAEAQWPRTELRNPEQNYNKMAVADLIAKAPGFAWDTYLKEIGLEEASVNVGQPSFAGKIAELVSTTSIQDWRSYLRFSLLDGAAPFLGESFQAAHFELHGRVLSGIAVQKTREERALEALAGQSAGDFGVLGDALGRLYVAKHFPAEAKARMDQLVANLLKAYRVSIDELTWMSPETKAKAQEKLAKYTVKIGYPQQGRNYDNLAISEEDLVGNMKAASLWAHARILARQGKPVDRTEWGMTPQTVNAYYNPTMNEIVFPAAILQPPFFNDAADDAVNYGGIGAVIGHEISHGFDDEGSQFDGDGNLKSWWTEGDRRAFEALTSRLVDQYAAYEPLPGQKINGALTLGENIADVAGLAVAYKAYKLSLNGTEAPVIDGMTGEQRFFIGWSQVWARKYRDAELSKRLLTDPHSPSQYRANGAPVNADAFHKAFDTKPGDKMYRASAERVRIW